MCKFHDSYYDRKFSEGDHTLCSECQMEEMLNNMGSDGAAERLKAYNQRSRRELEKQFGNASFASWDV